MSVSSLQDNYFVVHSSAPNEGDHLMLNEHKTEIVALLCEQVRKSTRAEVNVLINDSLQYRTGNNDTRQVLFQRNEAAQQPQLKKQAKQLLVMVATGLPKDTGTCAQSVCMPHILLMLFLQTPLRATTPIAARAISPAVAVAVAVVAVVAVVAAAAVLLVCHLMISFTR